MVIFPLAPDQTIAQMWSNGARGGMSNVHQFAQYEKPSCKI